MPDGAPWTPTRGSHAHFPGVPVLPTAQPTTPLASTNGPSPETQWQDRFRATQLGCKDGWGAGKEFPDRLFSEHQGGAQDIVWRWRERAEEIAGQVQTTGRSLYRQRPHSTTVAFSNVGGPKMDFMKFSLPQSCLGSGLLSCRSAGGRLDGRVLSWW